MIRDSTHTLVSRDRISREEIRQIKSGTHTLASNDSQSLIEVSKQ